MTDRDKWYTPPKYITAVREVMGDIDVDPASHPVPQSWIQAKTFYTETDDGLAQDWYGRVYLCPPAVRGGVLPFAQKLVDERTAGRVTEAVVLVNNGTDTRWGQLLGVNSDAVCFPQGRIRFLDQARQPTCVPIQGQMFVYLGPNTDRFRKVFQAFGRVMQRRRDLEST